MLIDSNTIKNALHAADNPRLLATTELLAEAAEAWQRHEHLGIDTEFVRERTYRADLGLVQVSDGDTAWLIDTVRIENLAPLKALCANTGIIKVFHSASEDLEVLWHTLGVTPAPIMDTQIACAMLGQPLQMSYHHSVKWMTGVEVDKEQTRSNWLHRPLTPRQLHYAATDVVFLPAMHKQLHHDLLHHGRWPWLSEEVTRMAENSRLGTAYEQAWLRINGCHKLDTPSVQVLKALAAWREKTAFEQNRARSFVVPDAMLLQLALKKPKTMEELLRVKGIHPGTLQTFRDPLLLVINQNTDVDGPLEQQLPLDTEQRLTLNSLRDAVMEKATALKVDPALLASKKQLEALLRARIAGKPIPEKLTGWRQTVITESLLNLATALDSS